MLRTAPAPDGWNARFSAIRRALTAICILNRRARPALLAGRVMARVAAAGRGGDAALPRTCCWAGTTSPRSAPPPARHEARCARSTGWTCGASGDMVEIIAEARSFLHHQVRNMVGTLRLVGDGSWRVERVGAALAARDRAAAGPTAPADGLCLMEVGYLQPPFGDADAAMTNGPTG